MDVIDIVPCDIACAGTDGGWLMFVGRTPLLEGFDDTSLVDR